MDKIKGSKCIQLLIILIGITFVRYLHKGEPSTYKNLNATFGPQLLELDVMDINNAEV